MAEVRGMTIALNTGDTTDVLSFYSMVFDRGPDTAPMDDFLEWQLCPGAWLQLSTGHDRPGANGARVRIEVDDVEAAVRRIQAAEVPVGDVVVVADVVAFANFSDNWGNALGYYQLLSPRSIVDQARQRREDREWAETVAANAESALAGQSAVSGGSAVAAESAVSAGSAVSGEPTPASGAPTADLPGPVAGAESATGDASRPGSPAV